MDSCSTLQTKKLVTGEREGRSRREQISRKRPLYPSHDWQVVGEVGSDA